MDLDIKINNLEKILKDSNFIEKQIIESFLENVKRRSSINSVKESYNLYCGIVKNCSILRKNYHEILFYLVKSIYEDYTYLNDVRKIIK